jgi:hypothetical protein
MTLAAVLLGTVIALIIGCGFHFWKGGGLKWLVVFNLFSIVGFWAGHIIGGLLKLKILPLGPINAGPAIITCLIVLFGGYWLSMASVEPDSEKTKKRQ